MEFVLNGQAMSLTVSEVEDRLSGQRPEPVQTHGVRVSGVVFPVKQAFAIASGVPRTDFTSHTARRLLGALGFALTGATNERPRVAGGSPSDQDPRAWPWEGEVQQAFSDWLRLEGWEILSSADTATKAHGVDVVARKGDRQLGAEAKGWPSEGYADPRRAAETKRTRPTTQAGHWYSQALMKAIMLLDSHPGYESLVVVPDYPRYRDLARRTQRGRAAAGIHVVFMEPTTGLSETWSA